MKRKRIYTFHCEECLIDFPGHHCICGDPRRECVKCKGPISASWRYREVAASRPQDAETKP